MRKLLVLTAPFLVWSALTIANEGLCRRANEPQEAFSLWDWNWAVRLYPKDHNYIEILVGTKVFGRARRRTVPPDEPLTCTVDFLNGQGDVVANKALTIPSGTRLQLRPTRRTYLIKIKDGLENEGSLAGTVTGVRGVDLSPPIRPPIGSFPVTIPH